MTSLTTISDVKQWKSTRLSASGSLSSVQISATMAAKINKKLNFFVPIHLPRISNFKHRIASYYNLYTAGQSNASNEKIFEIKGLQHQ